MLYRVNFLIFYFSYSSISETWIFKDEDEKLTHKNLHWFKAQQPLNYLFLFVFCRNLLLINLY